MEIALNTGAGPGAYNADAPAATGKHLGGQKTSSADRYAILQRKLEDLERIHAEGKKSVSYTTYPSHIALMHSNCPA